MSKKTTPKARTASPFTFKILIDDGSRGRQVARELSYPKRPARWTAIDLLRVVRTMAKTAADVKRKKITDRRLTVWFEGRDGGTEITVTHVYGAWAKLPGRSLIRIPSPAIAGLYGLSAWGGTAHMELPAALPVDTVALRKSLTRQLATHDRVRAIMAAEMAELDAATGAR